MDFTAKGILDRMKAELKSEENKMEGCFSMDNLSAVSEELARYHTMLITPLQEEIGMKKDDSCTSGNERHYIKWAKEVTNAEGEKVIGNARVYGVRDGSGIVYLSLISPTAEAPSDEDIILVKNYIETLRPVGAKPIITAAKAVNVRIAGTIEIREGVLPEEITLVVKKHIQEYFTEIAFKKVGTLLNYHRIGSIMNAVDGILDVIHYTVNDQEDSLTAEYDEYFKLEGLVLNG